MIEIRMNKNEFEYDIRSVVQAFFPGEELHLTVTAERSREMEESKAFKIQYEASLLKDLILTVDIFYRKADIKVILSYEEQILEEGRVETENEERLGRKNKAKGLLYDLLSSFTGKVLPWGTLTGIRPAKIVMNMLEHGMPEHEIMDALQSTYRAGRKKSKLCVETAERERHLLKHLDYENGYSLYIGIPFCESTCLYCSFTSYPIALWQNRVEEYLDALEQELLFTTHALREKKLNTIYIGGGTPTSLSAQQLDRLLRMIGKYVSFEHVIEFTVEAGRPDSITPEKLEVIKHYPVTRISINPQTMKEETLRLIGRNHTADQTIAAYEMARNAGFDNINMDLIVGLPNESKDDVEETLLKIRELGPDSLTVHSLALKRAARLQMFREQYEDLRVENSAEIMEMTECFAKEMGLLPYYLYRQKNIAGNFENVGYAKPDKAGIYNILIMEEKQSIMAIGAGSISKVVFENGTRIERADNVKDIALYLQRIDEMLERKRKLLEFV